MIFRHKIDIMSKKMNIFDIKFDVCPTTRANPIMNFLIYHSKQVSWMKSYLD